MPATKDFIEEEVQLDTDGVPEGSNNQYFTDQRAMGAVFDDTIASNLRGWTGQKIQQEINNAGHADDDVETVTGDNVDVTDPRNVVVLLQTALQTVLADTNNKITAGNVEEAFEELSDRISALVAMDLTPDLKSTGNPNEYIVELSWTDINGVQRTTTDPTPITFVDNQLTAQVIKAGPNSTESNPTVQITNTVGGAPVTSDEFALPVPGPFLNPDNSKATQGSTAIKYQGDVQLDGNLTLSGLPQTSDKLFLLAIDDTTSEVTKQAIPSSAAIGSSIENKLLVKSGNAAKSIAAIIFEPWAGSTITPTIATPGDSGRANTMVIPFEDHGGIWVNGVFVGNTVKAQTEWLQLSLGDTLHVTGGFSGGTMVADNAWAPIYHTGFGGKEFSVYVFRGATAASPALLGILVGDQEAEIILQDWNGDEVYRQTHDPLEVVNIEMDNEGNSSTQREWRLTTSADVTVGKMHSSASATDPIDVSIIFPALAEPLIGHMRSGFATSYDNAAGNVDVFMRDGVVGNGTVAYGAPFSVSGFGADQRLGPNGAGILYPQNKISCYSGADADGGELVPFTPLSWLPNCVGFPRHNGLDRISISARFEGNLYYYDDTNTLIATQRITRTNTTDQRHPAATSILSNNAIYGGVRPSYVIADMPIDVKLNLAEPDRSGPTSTDTNDTEETIVHGITTDGFVAPRYNPALNEWQVFNTATDAWERG